MNCQHEWKWIEKEKHRYCEKCKLHQKGYLLKSKNDCLIPERFAIEMQKRGWILRSKIVWHKPNVMPSSVKDRFTIDYEMLYMFSKNKKYFFETQYEPIQTETIQRNNYGWDGNKKAGAYSVKRNPGSFASKMPPIGGKKQTEGNFNPTYSGNQPEWSDYGRNKRTVWKITTKPFKEAHFAVYPEELCEIPLQAGCPKGGIVLDPFFGSGTTGLVALKQNKNFIGIELNPKYIEIAEKRLLPYLEQEKLWEQ